MTITGFFEHCCRPPSAPFLRTETSVGSVSFQIEATSTHTLVGFVFLGTLVVTSVGLRARMESAMANRDIVAIGTSAGGVEALLFLAKRFPPQFPAAVSFTIHLPVRSARPLTSY